MGEAPQETFLPDLFQGLGYGASGRGFNRLPVKQAVIYLLDPTKTAPENWTTSCVITGHLVTALRGQTTFWTANHTACLRGGRLAVSHKWELRAEAALTAALEGDPVKQARCM